MSRLDWLRGAALGNHHHCTRPLLFVIKPAVDKSVERVQTKLASMLNRLELEITEVEKRIGDKMVRITCKRRDFTHLKLVVGSERAVGRIVACGATKREDRVQGWKREFLPRNLSDKVVGLR